MGREGAGGMFCTMQRVPDLLGEALEGRVCAAARLEEGTSRSRHLCTIMHRSCRRGALWQGGALQLRN